MAILVPEEEVDVVPSTFDVPITKEYDADPILATLRNARDRIRFRHSVTQYVASSGAVCALGGIYVTQDKMPCDIPGGSPRYPADYEEIAFDAQEAIRLLDNVAEELYPECMGEFNNWPSRSRRPGYNIEDVNQAFIPPDPKKPIWKKAKAQAKIRTLHCYDVAIERRKLVRGA